MTGWHFVQRYIKVPALDRSPWAFDKGGPSTQWDLPCLRIPRSRPATNRRLPKRLPLI